MAKFNELYNLAKKYGTEANEEAAIENTTEGVVLNWVNNISIEMQKILMKKSKSRRNKLAQSLNPQVLQGSNSKVIKVGIVTDQDYYDYVDKGVQKSPKGRGGAPNPTRNKAPASKYKFKNVGTSDGMVESIKGWTAFAGEKADDAKKIAYFVKRGGLKPKYFISGAITSKAKSELSESLSNTLGRVVKTQLINYSK
jgi:hypothetical protein